ncbi:MAG: hypothetical protein KC620_20685, partial [Myxococcales bacterium]|nr:hypothetical protein [Myxococcales bacterium]
QIEGFWRSAMHEGVARVEAPTSSRHGACVEEGAFTVDPSHVMGTLAFWDASCRCEEETCPDTIACLAACGDDAGLQPESCALCAAEFIMCTGGFGIGALEECPGECFHAEAPDEEACGCALCYERFVICAGMDPFGFYVLTDDDRDDPPGAELGESCLRSACQTGLLCIEGICRAPCGSDACAAGSTCHQGACLPSCEPGAPCATEGERCAITQLVGDVVVAECRPAGDGMPGDACRAGSGYWGDCSPAFTCVEGRCSALCSTEDASECAAPAVCVEIFNVEGLGGCGGDCDVLAAEPTCPEGERCQRNFSNAGYRDGTEYPVGRCEPILEERAAGEACEPGVHTCPPRHACASRPERGAPTICAQHCIEGSIACPGGQTCVPVRGRTLGLCFQTPD